MNTPAERRMPREFTSEAKAPEQRNTQTARKELNSTDVCPTCGKHMHISSANGHRVFVCMDHTTVLPVT